MRTWTIVDHSTDRPLTMNALVNLNRFAWAKHTRETRGRWWLLAREASIPPLAAATITVTPLHRDGRSPQDVGAMAPHVKAVVDGLIDAGVLPDDDPTHLHAITYRGPRVCGHNGLELVITEVTERSEP